MDVFLCLSVCRLGFSADITFLLRLIIIASIYTGHCITKLKPNKEAVIEPLQTSAYIARIALSIAKSIYK